MVKWTLSFEGDYHEDQHELRGIANIIKKDLLISDAQDRVRSRLKYGENISEQEEKFLEELNELLHSVEGLE